MDVVATAAARSSEASPIVFANAGIGTIGAAGEMDPGEWRRVLDVNLSGVFYTVRESISASRWRAGTEASSVQPR